MLGRYTYYYLVDYLSYKEQVEQPLMGTELEWSKCSQNSTRYTRCNCSLYIYKNNQFRLMRPNQRNKNEIC